MRARTVSGTSNSQGRRDRVLRAEAEATRQARINSQANIPRRPTQPQFAGGETRAAESVRTRRRPPRASRPGRTAAAGCGRRGSASRPASVPSRIARAIVSGSSAREIALAHSTRVVAELHRQRGVGGGADARVEDHGHAGALADQAQVVGVQQAHAGADRRAERHHRGAADVLQPAREDRVVVGVREHDEAVVDELLGGLEQRRRVGQQRALVADHLELDPVGLERLAGELRGEHRVARREAAGGVGQQPDAGAVEHVDDRAALRPGRCGAARR